MRTRFPELNWVKWCIVVAGLLGGAAHAQNKKAIYFGPTHNSAHVSVNVAGIAAIGSGSVIWTPGDANAALNWDLKTVADFKAYDVIVISDIGVTSADPTSPNHWAGAIRNASVWSQAVTGNILIIGGDPEGHVLQWNSSKPAAELAGATELIQKGIQFAANDAIAGPGLYVALAEVHHDTVSPLNSQKKAIPHLLSGLGNFRVVSTPERILPDGEVEFVGPVVKVGTGAELNSLHGPELSDWTLSAHSAFIEWPTTLFPVAVHANLRSEIDQRQLYVPSTAQYTPPLASVPYILARGLTHQFTLTRGSQGKRPGQTVTFTAKVSPIPTPGSQVVFKVISGPDNGIIQTRITDNSGSATFSYTNNGTAGTDQINCFIDANLDSVHDDTEISTSGTCQWQQQVITLSRISDATEGTPGTIGRFRVTRQSASLATALVVPIWAVGTAEGGTDFTLNPSIEVVIPVGANTADITVTPINDSELEGPEHILLWVQYDHPSYAIDGPVATVNINDNEVAPSVSVDSATLAGGDPNAAEANLDPGKFRISRNGSLADGLDVDFILPLGTGRGFLGGDYLLFDEFDNEIQSRVTIQPGSTFTDVSVFPVADTRNEGTESVRLQIVANSPAYSIGTAYADISITDDPQDVIAIPTSYTITEVATQQGTYHQRYAYSVNNSGMVVGDRNSGGYGSAQRGYKWLNGSTTPLSPLFASGYCYAFAVNDSGVAVGYGNYYSSYDQPIRWDNATPTFLYPAAWGNAAVAINSAGYIVGSVKKSNGKYAAASWAPGTTSAEDPFGGGVFMGNLADDDFVKVSEANGINNQNRVVGRSMILANNSTLHAFRTQNATAGLLISRFTDDLGTESGIDAHNSEAWDINDSDEVVGGTMTSVGEFQAFLRSSVEGKHIGFTRLGCLPGGNWSIAQAINSKGTVVGRSRVTLTGGSIRAYVYFNNGVMRNLNEMIPAGSGWVLIGAEDINDDGHIVGYGTKNGETKAFRLVPNN